MEYLDSYLYYFLALCCVISALSSMVEAAYLSFDRIHINRFRKSRNIFDKVVFYFLNRMEHFLVTILLTNLVANTFATWLFMRLLNVKYTQWLPDNLFIRDVEVVLLFTMFVLIFLEFLPKQIGFSFNRLVAYTITWFYMLPYVLFYPFSHGYTLIFRYFLKDNKTSTSSENTITEVNKEELLQYIKLSSQTGALSNVESLMIKNVIEHKDLPVRTVMLPRMEIEMFNINSLPANFIKVVRKASYNHLIFYENSTDNIVGVAHKTDFVYDKNFESLDETNIKKYLNPAFFLLDSMSMIDAFEKIHDEKTDIFFVVDEFGGLQGLISYHDIISKVLGRVHSQEIEKQGDIRYLGVKNYLVKGNSRLVDFNHYFDCNIFHKNVETIGGYIVENLQYIPTLGEIYEDDWFKYTVHSVGTRRIEELLVEEKERGENTDGN